uniref:WGS project CAEQ00000000 data, annotated contig 2050 n=1 Tax=Trypanosoma congolense (strain IL3000) TaxID=1068625 RepID=F9WB23_TRYCI|nr:unnamed protein product [Trypanosoma congolense IL3000]
MPRYTAMRRLGPVGHNGGLSSSGVTAVNSVSTSAVGNGGVPIGAGGPAGRSIGTGVTDVTSSTSFLIMSNSTSAAGGSADVSDEEVDQLLKELERSVDTPQAAAVMRDAVWAIERRAFSSCDPHSRDLFLEHRIRGVLSEFSKTGNVKRLLLAVEFIDALLAVPYTNPQQRFTRLCRSLFSVLHCGIEEPAREAQRVLRRMLSMDAHSRGFDTPLKLFITKELRDNCKLSLIQLHGRTQQTKIPFAAQFLSIMLAAEVTAQVSPRYISGTLRQHVVQLATALAGSSDVVLRHAAYDCLVELFKNTSAMRHNEVVLENRRVLDEAIRSLNSSHNNEGSIISTLQTLRALISSRGVYCMDKQVHILPQLCVLVTEQHRISKTAAVRNAVCDLVPVIAETDIGSAARRTTYCAIIMEPVKNIRKELHKDLELRNVAIFIHNVGYDVLDATNRTNLDSILMRYITRLETQEECWHVLAAICRSLAGSGSRLSCTAGKSSFNATRSSSVIGRGETIAQPQSVGDISVSTQDQRSASVDDQSQHSPLISETQYNRANHQLTQHAEGLVRRCLPHMAHAVLSENLVQYVSVMQEHVPSLSSELQGALDALVDHTLRCDLSHHCNPDASNGCETPQPVREEQPQAGEGHSLTPQDASQSSTLFTANSTVGRLAQYLLPSVNNAAVDNGDNGVASADGGGKGIASGVAQPALSDTQSAGSASGFADDDASAMRPRPVGAAEIKIALEVFSRRPMTTVQQLDEMRSIIVQYQRHPDKRVPQPCCVSVIEALKQLDAPCPE